MNTNAALQPKIVFDCFAEVNKVPRSSKHEEKMIAFLQDFGKKLGLETDTDATGGTSYTRGWYLTLTYNGATVSGYASNTEGVFDRNASNANEEE